MPKQVFLNELGSEPLGYIGLIADELFSDDFIHKQVSNEAELALRFELKFDSHKHYSKLGILTTVFELDSAQSSHGASKGILSIHFKSAGNSLHKVKSNTGINVVAFRFLLENAIHKQYTSNQFNAPVNFVCKRYLDTPYECRVLETPTDTC